MCSKDLAKLLLLSYFALTTIQIIRAQGFSLNPDIRGANKTRECFVNNTNNIKGICVLEKYCTAEHEIAGYGIIDDSELREKKQCRDNEWCCLRPRYDDDSEEQTDTPPGKKESNENNGKENEVGSTSTACMPIQSVDCPWCATLHKGTLNDMFETGLYCMGSMIGPKVILTSASCILGAQNVTMWAQVPTSPKPKQQYAIRSTKLHPNYNTGTHEFDFGLVVLQEDVSWGQQKWIGACLGLEAPVKGACLGFGFDGNNKIVSTLLTSTPGGCSGSGDTPDAACSRKTDREDYCIIAYGSPIYCEGSNDVRGVARRSCYNDAAIVGSLSSAKDWITAELKTLNLQPINYLIKPF
ncbi:uncharacterized protein LOC121729688 [Aricia agestis]|uniref:uncharacterized protein LOC121729688 n=1 Tax=Aricia agestis TaxID=91739 RepID=UPI001C207965|nr:uncharacterized protein LOC121729688 [Aricia agestis]